MKDNKTVQVFLAIALIGIWGTVIYRVIEGMRGNDGILINDERFPLVEQDQKEEFTFALRLDYTDPFLKTSFITQAANDDLAVNASNIQAPPPQKVKSSKPKKSIQFPQISYHGMIKNKNTGVKYALLKIWNKSHRMKMGQVKNGIHLIQIERDSIQIYFNGHMKAFEKE